MVTIRHENGLLSLILFQAVFFPGMFDDPDEILSKTRAIDSEPTCVEMLAGPSLELRYALQELVFFSGLFQTSDWSKIQRFSFVETF